jgi:hypothetical protein
LGARFINGSGAWRGEVVKSRLGFHVIASQRGAHSRAPLARNDGLQLNRLWLFEN